MTSITFTGNLAGDVESRSTPSGRQVARFTVIENRRRKNDETGEWEDGEPNVYRVQAWQGLAENVAASLSTGDRVVIVGSVRTDRWTDKETQEARTGQHVVADEVGYSLKFHTVTATKAPTGQQAADVEEPPF